ncbi:hypothetical protein ADL03_26870 [Nocardia sp. NRRL S-836]|nr:hypothetical protein ADL03_26870 [Nocardia sp. NRRL S-836]
MRDRLHEASLRLVERGFSCPMTSSMQAAGLVCWSTCFPGRAVRFFSAVASVGCKSVGVANGDTMSASNAHAGICSVTWRWSGWLCVRDQATTSVGSSLFRLTGWRGPG